MIFFKPVFRTVILSFILCFLLIYLGIKYHWGDYFKNTHAQNTELHIPQQVNDLVENEDIPATDKQQEFIPEIVKKQQSSSMIISMNKEQIAEQCTNLLSKTVKDNLSLDLAVANCVVSNFQETYQSVATKDAANTKKNKALAFKKCSVKNNQLATYSKFEKQLLLGICVSDELAK